MGTMYTHVLTVIRHIGSAAVHSASCSLIHWLMPRSLFGIAAGDSHGLESWFESPEASKGTDWHGWYVLRTG